MPDVITIGGSPSLTSKTAAVLDYVQAILANQGLSTATVRVRDLPAEDLLHVRPDSPSIRQSITLLEQASSVVIATPVYKAAYSGILKAYLDLLPRNILAGKLVLPLATGGSLAHTLAISYALTPVLASLGANHILDGVYLVDSDLHLTEGQPLRLTDALDARLRATLAQLTAHVTGAQRILWPGGLPAHAAVVGSAHSAE